MSRVLPPPGFQKTVPGARSFPLKWRFSGGALRGSPLWMKKQVREDLPRPKSRTGADFHNIRGPAASRTILSVVWAKRLRGFLADRPEAVTALTSIFLDRIARLLHDAAGASLQCPSCGGDIRLRGNGRQDPAHFEPKVRKRAKARMASPAWNHHLTRLGEPPEPPRGWIQRRAARSAKNRTVCGR